MDIYDQLKRDEGTGPLVGGCLKPYRDTVGKLTIGYGRNLDDKGITQQEAEDLLKNDVLETVNNLEARLPWVASLDEPRWAVLVNMAFNLGVEGLLKFQHTLGLVQANRWEQAAEAMLDSRWASQVKDRARRLADQMRTGEWR